MNHQTFCNLCESRPQAVKLVRRGTFLLCPECYAREEHGYWKDIATDPSSSAAARAFARRKVRTLGRLLVSLRKESA